MNLLLSDFFFKQFDDFLIGWEAVRFCLGVNFFSVQINLKSPARAFFFLYFQIKMFANFICQTDSLIVIVSSNTIFDDNAVHGLSEVK
jgi:hypothetical protein